MSALVSVIMGSYNDLEVMKGAYEMLDKFGVKYEKRVMSAHRTPYDVEDYIKKNNFKIIIAGAGVAAHLAGVIAAFTTSVVIGVPIYNKTVGGLDALLSMVQMPPGIPVATVAINGAKNAAILAVEVLALSDESLAKKLKDFRIEQREAVLKADAELNG